jgi:phosphoesterase RecJ-like protein
MRAHPDYNSVPAARREAIERLGEHLVPGTSIALSTHVNADGDGCGSEAALALLFAQRDIRARVVNPTPWPDLFGFLLGGVRDDSAKGSAALRDVDALLVVDISDVRRLGSLSETVRRMTVPRLVIDHHVPSDDPPGSIMLSDTSACATAELVYDVACVLDFDITPAIARALYVGLLTDTGGFRFSNTTPRCHAVAGDLLSAGVDPEEMYLRIYASAPAGRIRLLAQVLQTLGVDEQCGLSWLSMEAGMLERFNVRQEDLDGIVEHARSIAGTRLALFFRDLGHGKVKVSFRSTGDVDVNEFARRFGGGGHARAAGALIAGALDAVRERVLGDARGYVGECGSPAAADEQLSA